MSDISDTIQESVSHAGESKINSRVALFVALTATFMAICNVKDGNVVQAMSQAQAHSIDSWSYFQAKSTKQTLLENQFIQLELQLALNANAKPAITLFIQKQMQDAKTKIDRYESEKAQIKAQAEGFQKEYDDINIFDDQFDMTDALLSIAIAMFGITALTQKKWLLYFASAMSLAGFVFGIAAFMHISLHSDLVSKILG